MLHARACRSPPALAEGLQEDGSFIGQYGRKPGQQPYVPQPAVAAAAALHQHYPPQQPQPQQPQPYPPQQPTGGSYATLV